MSREVLQGKVVLLGTMDVGKTSIVARCINNTFNSEELPTLGVNYSTKMFSIGTRDVTLRIWDTAGQEQFRSMAPLYYQESNAALIVFDITNAKSFDDVTYWINELSTHLENLPKIYIAGNKSDLITDRKMPFERGDQLADQIGGLYFEISAKTGQGVQDLFTLIADQIREIVPLETQSVAIVKGNGKKSKCRC
jgi:small GTP-binding protein